jgi:hypothetical protein
MKAEEARD